MDEIAVRRFKTFAKVMIFHGGFPHITERRKQRLWEEAQNFIGVYGDEPFDGWDGEPYPACDAFSAYFAEYERAITVIRGREAWQKEEPHYFANQLHCIVRASLNASIGDGYGVIGWSVGDLREMFGGEIPDWVADRYIGRLENAPNGAMVVL